MTDEELRIISKEIFGEPLSFIDMDLNKFIEETNKPDVLRRCGIDPDLQVGLDQESYVKTVQLYLYKHLKFITVVQENLKRNHIRIMKSCL